MSAVAHTQFAGRSPFAGPAPKKPKTACKPVDVASMSIADDPLPSSRTSTGDKYSPLFAKLQPGQCIKCEPEAVGPVSHALNKWIKNQGLKDHVARTAKRYEADGKGRVWLINLGPKK